MRLGRRPNQQDEAQVDLTSMLDIVFIMLIFFIVTSSFVRESGVEVNRPPQASNVVSQKDAGIFIAVTAANDVYIDKRVVDIERVEASIEHLLLDQPDASLVIQADEHAYNGTVVKVMDAAKAAGVKNIALAAEKP
ncbi:LOW QUALITY PROTEIN: biopolymer transport protein ExbD/TolR [Vibrio sp. JCM 18904]|nr:LOW QUALITY PROTEIN: biopolymer transport protein ExbD/TolR [Vibrio sp. JCM 18904]